MSAALVFGWIGLVLIWIFLSIPKAIVYSVKKTFHAAGFMISKLVQIPSLFLKRQKI